MGNSFADTCAFVCDSLLSLFVFEKSHSRRKLWKDVECLCLVLLGLAPIAVVVVEAHLL